MFFQFVIIKSWVKNWMRSFAFLSVLLLIYATFWWRRWVANNYDEIRQSLRLQGLPPEFSHWQIQEEKRKTWLKKGETRCPLLESALLLELSHQCQPWLTNYLDVPAYSLDKQANKMQGCSERGVGKIFDCLFRIITIFFKNNIKLGFLHALREKCYSKWFH